MKVKAMKALTLPLKVDLKHVHLTDEQFYQLCINNPELNIERSAKGALIFMPPVGGDSGIKVRLNRVARLCHGEI